jgi:hypothetical protein
VPFVQVGSYRLSLLDPALFWRKVAMLVIFFGLFVPLKIYQQQLLDWYVVFLLALHVYILFVFLYRVRWKILAADRKAFAVRLVAIGTFVLLLTVIKVGVTLPELLAFVALSGIVHLALLLSLTVNAEHVEAAAAATDA